MFKGRQPALPSTVEERGVKEIHSIHNNTSLLPLMHPRNCLQLNYSRPIVRNWSVSRCLGSPAKFSLQPCVENRRILTRLRRFVTLGPFHSLFRGS